MYQNRITPYEGKEPYIFISYAHKDSDRVLPVLGELDRRNYRIWYDDGIAPGSEWPENIAQHLNDSALTLAFVSPNSIASANCRREVTFALAKRKPFLAVILEPTEMSLGMEMQLSAQQCIMKYQYQTEESFLEKLCSCPDIVPCLASEPVKTEPAIPRIELLPPQEEPLPEPAVQMEPATAPEPIKKPARRPKVKKEKPRREKKTGKRKLPWILGICAAVLALCIALPLLSDIRVTDDKKLKRNESYLRLYQETITVDTVRQINKLKKLQYITFDQCVFEPGALGELVLPERMRDLTMEACRGVDDLLFLNVIPELEHMAYLTIKNCGIGDEQLPQLQLTSLRQLNLEGNPGITDLRKCSDCTGLQRLYISGTGVSDLSPVAALPLTEISFAGTKVADVTTLGGIATLNIIVGSETQVTNVDALGVLEELKTINFSNCRISDIRGTFTCLRLQELDLSGNPVEDISAFADCTVLRKVVLGGTNVKDISFLEKSCGDLKTLDVSGCPMAWSQLHFLKDCPNLDALYMDGIKTSDLRLLENAENLTVLSAVDCGITDISFLSGCTKLVSLGLARNKITDVSPLGNLQGDKWLVVDLSFNQITDFSQLPQGNYALLCLLGEENDISMLQVPKCSVLAVHYSEALMGSWIKELSCYDIRVIGCPADKQVKLEDHIGTSKLRLVDSWEELAELLEQKGLRGDYLLDLA